MTVHEIKVDNHWQIYHLHDEQTFAYDLKRSTQSRLERHVVDGADAVTPFDMAVEHEGQIWSYSGIEDAGRRC